MTSISLADGFNQVLYETPASPLADIALNGTVVDLVDAARRVGSSKSCIVISWVDSAVAFSMTAVFAIARFVHDLALAILFSLAWPFSATARNACKIHLGRAGIDLVGALGSIISIFYPPLIKTILIWLLSKGENEGEDARRIFTKLHKKLNRAEGINNLHNQFFEKV